MDACPPADERAAVATTDQRDGRIHVIKRRPHRGDIWR
jgi:hypothetical protein